MKRKKLLVPRPFFDGFPAIFDGFSPKTNTPTRCFPTFSAPRPCFGHLADRFSSFRGNNDLCPRRQILQPTASNSSRHGINFFATRHQILRATDKNFFSGLEIYFKALEIYFSASEIYFSASEIYFKATEIVLSRAEKKFIACRKEVWGTG